MTENSSMKLSKARLTQIKAIAAAHNVTTSDLVARWVRQEIEAGVIPAEFPGVKIEIKTGDHVQITMGDLRLDPTRPEAVEFSKRLREISKGHEAALNASFATVKRQGAGISVVSPFTGRRFPMSPTIAGEVADQIDAALK